MRIYIKLLGVKIQIIFTRIIQFLIHVFETESPPAVFCHTVLCGKIVSLGKIMLCFIQTDINSRRIPFPFPVTFRCNMVKTVGPVLHPCGGGIVILHGKAILRIGRPVPQVSSFISTGSGRTVSLRPGINISVIGIPGNVQRLSVHDQDRSVQTAVPRKQAILFYLVNAQLCQVGHQHFILCRCRQ